MVLKYTKSMMGQTFFTLNERIKLCSSHLARSKIMSHIFKSRSNAVFNSSGTEAGGWEGKSRAAVDMVGLFEDADQNLPYF